MCGIFFTCCQQEQHTHSCAGTCEFIKRRGPDSFKTIHRQVNLNSSESAIGKNSDVSYLTFAASVLSLRGQGVVEQPLEDVQSGSIFCWNGEAWKIDNTPIQSNDGTVIFDLLLTLLKPRSASTITDKFSDKDFPQAVFDSMSRISGPGAFLFYDPKHQHIFYGRDALGRRSLLQKIGPDRSFSLSSVCNSTNPDDWYEVDAGYMYRLDLSSKTVDRWKLIKGDVKREEVFSLSDKIYFPAIPLSLKEIHSSRNPFPSLNKDVSELSSSILNLDSLTVDALAQELRASLNLRVQNVSPPSPAMTGPHQIAILFSGGLDCTLLARLMHDLIPLEHNIDLLNVSFENPRVVRASKLVSSQQSYFPVAYSNCPDRMTGLSSHAELLRVCPGRVWRFVSIDIPYSETMAHRSQIIALMHPHNTEMDLSIATALYFAARGSGSARHHATGALVPYTTPARVLISGLGADELFAGYTRHAAAFTRRGFQGLVAELELDFNRLGKRNLGRDDRIISNWGKEVRYPFLDEDFVTWALQLPVWQKCGFGETKRVEAEGFYCPSLNLEPGKKLLRLLAWKLGMERAAQEKKRAIQFGARTAKMEAGKTKGTQAVSQNS